MGIFLTIILALVGIALLSGLIRGIWPSTKAELQAGRSRYGANMID